MEFILKIKSKFNSLLTIEKNLRKSLEKKQDDVLEKRAKMLEDAKLEARDILLSAKEEATEIIHELSASVDLKQANNLR